MRRCRSTSTQPTNRAYHLASQRPWSRQAAQQIGADLGQFVAYLRFRLAIDDFAAALAVDHPQIDGRRIAHNLAVLRIGQIPPPLRLRRSRCLLATGRLLQLALDEGGDHIREGSLFCENAAGSVGL
jgi:hypothetical protein